MDFDPRWPRGDLDHDGHRALLAPEPRHHHPPRRRFTTPPEPPASAAASRPTYPYPRWAALVAFLSGWLT